MRVAVVLDIVGHLLRRFSLAFLAPLALAILDGLDGPVGFGEAVAFAVGGATTVAAGLLLGRRLPAVPVLARSEALAVVSFSWLAVAVLGGIPFLVAGLSPVDAFFESMSGFTTTGATILTDFTAHHRAFHLWRGMTQWFGGLGVIALFVVVLPRLGIAGRQVFFAETSAAAGEAVSPQVRQAARRLWVLYIALTLVEALALVLTGFPLYDAVVHTLATMSAGGFSPRAESVAAYANPAAEWVMVAFMFLAGTSFTLLYRGFTRQPRAFFRDPEFLTYATVMLLLSLGVAALLAGGLPTADTLRTGAFQVSSLQTSTGFASTDFNGWSDALKTLLVLAMVVGGCAGSASGGAKVVRYVLATKWLGREITQVLHPQAVIPIRYGNRTIPNEVMRSVTSLVFLYVVGYAALGSAVVLLEGDVDLVTGYSAALACMGNIGPGFGGVGPMANYAFLSDGTKVLLSLGMWVGRLEILTVIALLHPHVWRRLSWRSGAEGHLPRPAPRGGSR